MSKNILEEANDIVHGARNQAYGSPKENHQRTADYWNVFLKGVKGDLTASDICVLNILQKISRWQHKPGRDHLVDIAGYSANIEIIEQEK